MFSCAISSVICSFGLVFWQLQCDTLLKSFWFTFFSIVRKQSLPHVPLRIDQLQSIYKIGSHIFKSIIEYAPVVGCKYVLFLSLKRYCCLQSSSGSTIPLFVSFSAGPHDILTIKIISMKDFSHSCVKLSNPVPLSLSEGRIQSEQKIRCYCICLHF